MSIEIKSEMAMFTYAFLTQNKHEASKRNNRLKYSKRLKLVQLAMVYTSLQSNMYRTENLSRLQTTVLYRFLRYTKKRLKERQERGKKFQT